MENLCIWEKLHENGPKIAGRLVNLDIIIYMICDICQPRNIYMKYDICQPRYIYTICDMCQPRMIDEDAADVDVDDVEEVNA